MGGIWGWEQPYRLLSRGQMTKGHKGRRKGLLIKGRLESLVYRGGEVPSVGKPKAEVKAGREGPVRRECTSLLVPPDPTTAPTQRMALKLAAESLQKCPTI